MTSEAVNQVTREEWRKLGFFYEFDTKDSRWRLVGSRSGLLKFRDILNAYADDTKNQQVSEHEHYGPYCYLKIMTWEDAEITEQAICGTLSDIRRLAEIVDSKLGSYGEGSKFTIGDEYAGGSKTVLDFEVQGEGFDPVSADSLLQSYDS